jgi:hypothetical protein
MNTTTRMLPLAAILATLPGCAGVLSEMVANSRQDLVEATGEDAATLILVPVPGKEVYITGVTDPARCRGTVNLGRPFELTGVRTFKLTPGQEFGYVFEGKKFNGSCMVLTTFTPFPRVIYRAELKTTELGCYGTLFRIEGDQKVPETTHTARSVRSGKHGGLDCK